MAMRKLVPWGHRGAVVLGPGVHVGVEVDHAERAMLLGRGPQQGQRHQVVTAHGDEMVVLGGLLLDHRQ